MLKALIKREIKEFYNLKRRFILYIVIVANILFLSFFFSNLFSKISKNDLASKIIINVMPIFIIIIFSYVFSMETIYSDKKNKSLEVFFSLSYSPFDIWLSKFAVTSFFVIMLYYTSILIAIIINIFTKTEIFLKSLNFSEIIIFLILSPLFGLSLTGLISMLFFVLKDPRILFLLLFFGFYLFFMFLKKITHFIPLNLFKTTNLVLFYTISATLIFTFIYLYLKRMKKEWWI